MERKTAIVIGAGIIGLATARSLSLKGFRVTVYERSYFSNGASVRNFGMIWPIGQPEGALYDRAIRSKAIWQQLAYEGAFWCDPVGSLHVANNKEEWEVMQEVHASMEKQRLVRLLNPSLIAQLSPMVNRTNLLGGLFSAEEMIVDPREVIRTLPVYLGEKLQVEFHWNKIAVEVSSGKVIFSDKTTAEADLIFICSGADLDTLYPELINGLPIIKCKLQMMRMEMKDPSKRIGPSLCGGLSLLHYKSFHQVSSFQALKVKCEAELSEYLDLGIHVMVSQNQSGTLTIGDSHQYANDFEPFDETYINQFILNYLKSFMMSDDFNLVQSWNGIYAKMQDERSELFLNPSSGVYLLTGVGGAGMTLSFGLAEEVCGKL